MLCVTDVCLGDVTNTFFLQFSCLNVSESLILLDEQVAPLDMYTEVNTKTNLPAQIEIYATDTNHYDFLFLAKGGGSANKTFLYQQTKALLNPEKLLSFVNEKVMVGLVCWTQRKFCPLSMKKSR